VEPGFQPGGQPCVARAGDHFEAGSGRQDAALNGSQDGCSQQCERRPPAVPQVSCDRKMRVAGAAVLF
jgi:hypothetical protein